MRKLVVVEGIPCTGKTTLVNQISNSHSYGIVPEISELLGPGEEFPGNGTTFQEIDDISSWFLDKEIKRNTLAGRLLEKADVVMDGSYIGIMAYNHAYELLTGIASSDYINFRILSHLSDCSILSPSAFILLDIGPDEMRNRLKQREDRPDSIMPSFWSEDRFLGDMMAAHLAYLSMQDSPVKIIDASKSPGYVLEQSLRFIEHL